MAYATVPCGPFFGATLAQLQARLATLQAAKLAGPAGGGGMTSASVNGRAFTYDIRGRNIDADIADVIHAMSYVDDNTAPVPAEQVFVSGSHGQALGRRTVIVIP
jgi:hypothetical protein